MHTIRNILKKGKANAADVLVLKSCLYDVDSMKASAHAIGSLKLVELLSDLFEVAKKNFQITIAFAIVQFGHKVVDELINKIDDRASVPFKSNAAIILGFFPTNNGALDLLLKLTTDKSPQVRRMAVHALQYFGNKRAIAVLEDLSTEDDSKVVCNFAKRSLAYIKNSKANEALRK